jgi:hypothetical protein
LCWFALFWALAATIRYIGAIYKALDDAYNPGDDQFLTRLWLTVLSTAFLLLLSSRARTFVFGVLAALLTVLIGAVIVLSGSVLPFLLAVWLVVWTFVYGDAALRQLGVRETDDLADRIVLAIPIGLSTLALLSLILGVIGMFNRGAAWAVLLVTTIPVGVRAVALAREYFREAVRNARQVLQGSALAPFLVVALGFMLLLNLTWSVAPEIQYDSLHVRLGVPQIYVNEGRFVDVPYAFHSYFVRIMEWVYGFCLALYDESVAKLLAAAVAIVAALSVYSLGRSLFSPNVGLWAAVLFYTTPLASWVGGTTYTDLAVALFASALVLSSLYYQRTAARSWLAVTAMLAAAALSVKLTAAPVVAAAGAAVAWLVWRTSEPLGQKIRSLDFPLALAFLTALPWHLLTFVVTGSPIFPMMNDLFRSPRWELVNTRFNLGDYGMGTSFGDLIRVPFRLVLDTARFGEALPRGSLGALLILFIPLGLVLALRRNSAVRLGVITTGVAVFLWEVVFQYGRYYLVVLPGVAALAVGGLYETLPKKVSRFAAPAILLALLLSQGAVTSFQYWNIPERYPIDVALGRESRRAFLLRSLGGYGATQHLNAVVPPKGRVLTIGGENLRFYINAPLESLSLSLIERPLRRAPDLKGEELAHALAEMGFTHLLFSRQDLQNPEPFYTYASPEFLREHAVLEYSDRAVVVYRLK